jgi:hypothetical protein
MNHVNKHRRGPTTVIGLLLSIAALLALAGPASAHHGHHHRGGEPAGTISSFDPDSGVLTIDLAKGGSISALVTDETSIEIGGDCKGGDHFGRHSRTAARAAGRNFGHDQGWHHGHHGWGHGQEGSTDDLVPGAVVKSADLSLVDGTATYDKVKLESPDSGESS